MSEKKGNYAYCAGEGKDDKYIEHPGVYINLDQGETKCPYCSRSLN